MFPLSHAKTYTIPSFVRGDDVFFSYANTFTPVTLNGIACWQEDFKNKECPMTVYLDMRTHIINAMIFDHLAVEGRWRVLKMLWAFFGRFNNSYFYDTANAIVLAFDDVLRGPEHVFTMNMPKKSGELTTRYVLEVPQPEQEELPVMKRATKHMATSFSDRVLRELSAYGHLFPAFILSRKRLWYMYRNDMPNANLTYLREKLYVKFFVRKKFFILKMNRKYYFKNLLYFCYTSLKFIIRYSMLKCEYRKFINDNLTTDEFWKKLF
jgi:hypothetical protein